VSRPQWITVRFYAGGAADEIPRTVEIAGEVRSVELVASQNEERSGIRSRRLRVRTDDGETLDLRQDAGTDRWLAEWRPGTDSPSG
jgi:hypothetical protein